MKPKLTTLILTSTIAMLALIAGAQVILPTPPILASGRHYTTLNGGTNTVPANATNSYAISQPCGDYDTVGLQVTLKGSGASTGTVTVRVTDSMDNGTTYATVPKYSLALTLAGTGQASGTALFNVGPASHLMITGIENPNGVQLTNLSATWILKSPKEQFTPTGR